MKHIRRIFEWLTLIILFSNCRRITSIFTPESPREIYKQKIQHSPIATKAIVQRWLAIGDSILDSPVSATVPFKTKIVYFNGEPNAWAWQFPLPEGRTLRVTLNRSDTTNRVFMDLYSTKNEELTLRKSAQDSILSYTPDQNQTIILRMQAELLVNGSSTLVITDQPSLAFPVQGGHRADIGGVFGDPRDSGARKHKGVDIFAKRGTPALAVADGRVARTGNHGLGGKQVWLRVNDKNIYYAHLDSINSHSGQKIQLGDTLGFVGNTGNARNSPPHLHFGIYKQGAINPLPFINFAEAKIEPITVDLENFSKWGRITAAKANVRPLPSTEEAPIISLKKENPVKIIGGFRNWYQVILPDETTGFIYKSLVEPANSRFNKRNLKPANHLFAQFTDRDHGFCPDSSDVINIYGQYKNRKLAKYRNHWVWTDE